MKIKWLSDWNQRRKKRKEVIANERKMRREKKIAELEEFVQPGDRFFYLDYEMLCTDVGYIWFYDCENRYEGIRAEYVNPMTGKIKETWFHYNQLNVLRKENERSPYKEAEDPTDVPASSRRLDS